MSSSVRPSAASIGQVMDSIWGRLPHYHYLNKIDPLSMPAPHENLLGFGKGVIQFCEESGAPYRGDLTGSDYSTWLRLVGAWALYIRQNPITRSEAGKKLGMDPSNLTNFLNGKRPLTTNAMKALALLFGIEAFDLRPELGANFARAVELKNARKINQISQKLDELIAFTKTSSMDSADEMMLIKLEDMKTFIHS